MRLCGYQWVILLKKQPVLSEYCDWDVLSSEDWGDLLSSHPEYIGYCNPENITNFDKFVILKKQPQLVDILKRYPTSFVTKVKNIIQLRSL